MDSNELIKFASAMFVLLLEWWMMQPYHEPLFARFWRVIAAISRTIAERFGRLALNAEHNYYISAEAGI